MNLKTTIMKHLGWCPMSPDKAPSKRTDGPMNLIDAFLSGWKNYLLTLALLSIILASSIIFTPPPLIPASSQPDTWNKTINQTYNIPEFFRWIKVNDPDINNTEQIIYDGDKVIEFRDQTVRYSNLLLLKDNAKLILRNCTLLVSGFTAYNPENLFDDFVGILLTDNSSLEAYDTEIVPSDYVGQIGFIGDSQCYLNDVVIANCTLHLDERAQLEAAESKIFSISIDKDVKIDISKSHVRYLHQDHKWRNRWSNIVEINSPTAHFTDSIIDFVTLRVTNSSHCNIYGRIGTQSDWNSYEALDISGKVMNLTLIDSAISAVVTLEGLYSKFNINEGESMWVYAAFSSVHCNNSEIQRIILSGNSTTSIQNCNIEHLATKSYISFTGEAFRSLLPSSIYQTLYLSDTKIEDLDLGIKTNVSCDNALIQDLHIGRTEVYISGTASYGSIEPAIKQYARWLFAQKYKVRTIGEERVIPDVELSLEDSNGEIIWSGISNENGLAEFNITYCSYYPLPGYSGYVSNYRDSWNLTGIHGDEIVTKQITMGDPSSEITLDYSKGAFILPVDNQVLFYSSLSAITFLTVLKLRFYSINKDLDPFSEKSH
jgi:hypothetical protein